MNYSESLNIFIQQKPGTDSLVLISKPFVEIYHKNSNSIWVMEFELTQRGRVVAATLLEKHD